MFDLNIHMPTPIEQTLEIIFSPESRLRETIPLVYQLPNAATLPGEARIRYLSQTGCADKTIRQWLSTEYTDIELQMPDQTYQDQSEIFALVREPTERWWSGIRMWMGNLPWYAWWQNDRVMQQWPHFSRFTLNQSTILDQAKPQHLIKCDLNLSTRIYDFARRHRLRLYGPLAHVKNHRHTNLELKKMEDKGRSQLEAWLKKNPDHQKKLDEYLAPDYAYWDRVKNQ